MNILIQPSSLSLVGNMNHIVINTEKEVSFVLADSGGNTIVKHLYVPSETNRIEVDLKNIIQPLLAFKLRDVSSPYQQTGIVKSFSATVAETGDGGETKSFSFTVIRAGVDHFDGDASSFLTQNFLTWQPNVKPVTYYTPEFLTYYAVVAATIRCKVYFEGDTMQSIALAQIAAGECWTVPVQYAVIAGKVGNKLPQYYEVWAEDALGSRLTYIQRYVVGDMRSEEEEWILFENSLGGIDTFRAYGDSENTVKHTHNVAEIEEIFEEYRVDTTREHKKNTGYLGNSERVWLLDFFPSMGKYVYTDNFIRRIVVTESDVSYNAKELPSNYNFTYKYADARPYLNLPRAELPQKVLNIKIPELGSFTVAPRLAEFPRLTLSGGALFPVENPYSEQWSVTTVAAILEYLIHEIEADYSGNGGIGHTHPNINLLNGLYLLENYLLANGNKIKAGYADEAGNADKWDGRHFADYLDQPVRKGDGVAFGSVESDELRSAGTFVDGLLGAGFRLWRDKDGVTYLTLDNLTVRQTMTVMELLIQKVRSVGGMIVVSAANGKIKGVEEQDGCYLIRFEQENTFVAHDLMRCQTFTGGTLKSYWVEVAGVSGDGIVVAKEEFGAMQPEAGDDCVLMGNTTDKSRQNLILISATEDGQPRVDVMDGVSGKTLDGALRARLGHLDGIRDSRFPANRQPRGNGLYADNAYLKGTFLLETGEDVRTKFEVTEGRIESAVEGVRRDLGGGHLSNATFGDGMAKWDTQNEAVFFLAGNRWVWANGGALSKKGDFASVTKDMGRTVVQIRNRYIRQRGENLQDVPSFQTGADGRKIPVSVHLSFFYRCSSAGVLRVGFENVDKRGFADFESMDVEERLEATDGYWQYTCGGLWNGTGDFRLSFTGEIYLHMLILSTDKAESLVYKYRTLFEQSEKLVRIAAQNFDKDGHVLSESGIMVKAEGSGIYAQTEDGKVALVGVGVTETGADGKEKTVIKLTADNIKLEGLVTANGNFKILEDGSIEAMNGKFGGEVNATSGKIGGFAIGDGHIGADYTGGAPGTDTAAGLFMRNDMLGFNAAGRQALMGTVSENGMPLLLRLTDTARDTLPRTALGVSVTGSVTDNIALDIDGGHVRGLAVRTRVIGLDRVLSPTAPSSLSVTLGREECAVYVTTRYYWSGSPTGTYASRERDVSVTLPVMRSCDDGHVVKIKRGTGGGTVRIVAGGCVISSLTSAGGYADTEGRTLIIADGSAGVAELTLDSPGDAMELVWFRDIGMTVDGTARKGAWVQWKNPRDW